MKTGTRNIKPITTQPNVSLSENSVKSGGNSVNYSEKQKSYERHPADYIALVAILWFVWLVLKKLLF